MKKSALFLISALVLTGCAAKEKEASNKDQTTFDITCAKYSVAEKQYLKGVPEQAAKDVGINLNWTVINNSDWSQKKSITFADQDSLPDAFFGGITIADSDVQANKNLFIPLEDLIEKNMPNLVKIMKEDPKIKPMITSGDGHIYSLPKRMPGRPDIGTQFFINDVWLKNLGVTELPQTTDELEQLMIRFRDEDPNKNGKQDEVPLVGEIDQIMGIYGIEKSTSTTPYMNWDPETKKVLYYPVTDEYKDVINYFNKLYKEKLLDNEIFTQDWNQMNSKRVSPDGSLVGVTNGWIMGTDEYEPLPAMTAQDGEKHILNNVSSYGRNELLITTKCKNPEKLLQWADKFYTEDASVQNYFGAFDLGTKKNSDGTYEILPGKDMPQNQYSDEIAFRDDGPKWVSDGFNDKLKFDTDDGDKKKLDISQGLSQYTKEMYPLVQYTDEEQTQISSMMADINGFVGANQAEWISGDGVSDSEWKAYLAQLDKMGLDDFLKLHQDALDRYEKVN